MTGISSICLKTVPHEQATHLTGSPCIAAEDKGSCCLISYPHSQQTRVENCVKIFLHNSWSLAAWITRKPSRHHSLLLWEGYQLALSSFDWQSRINTLFQVPDTRIAAVPVGQDSSHRRGDIFHFSIGDYLRLGCKPYGDQASGCIWTYHEPCAIPVS